MEANCSQLKIWSGHSQMSEKCISLSCSSEGLCLSHLEIHILVVYTGTVQTVQYVFYPINNSSDGLHLQTEYPHITVNFLFGNINAI